MFVILPIRDDTAIRRTPIVTFTLIVACTAVFLWQIGLPPRAADRIVYAYGMVPAVLFGEDSLPSGISAISPILTPVTCMFLHGGWLHLIGNMLYLGLFGRGVESGLGKLRFSLLYFLSGIAAALVQAATDPHGTAPMIGASGAIAGVLGAYLLLFPRANVDLFVWIVIFFRMIRLPAVVLLVLWFLLQLSSALAAPPGQPGVALWAHVGGFGAGLALVALLRKRHPPMMRAPSPLPFPIRDPTVRRQGSVPSAGRRFR